MTIRIAMWSGPRNISTAMMRSFGARADCTVSDEPFYGAYLKQSGEPQPMADTIIADMDCDWHSVTRALNGPPPEPASIWYQKHMPHHMIGPVDISAFYGHRHAFLIREPELVIASYAKKRVTVTFDDLRYDRQLEYVRAVADISGSPPPVIDSGLFLHDPEGHLRALCAVLCLQWDPAMLRWKAGLHANDGIWASHWYDRVAQSTHFAPAAETRPALSGSARALAERCRPFYQEMKHYALEPSEYG
ncbi:HAD family hydrolase [Pontixanthobacter sp.]|uniref:sulfotransferase-like domain-containing protein n=1 Tax=Pontixanthobacter sp. TaxID=2792078 RepID=UPI003C7971A3